MDNRALKNTDERSSNNSKKDRDTTNVMKVSVTYNGQVYTDHITMDSIKQAYRKAYEKAYSL
jgi:hypothetical protein